MKQELQLKPMLEKILAEADEVFARTHNGSAPLNIVRLEDIPNIVDEFFFTTADGVSVSSSGIFIERYENTRKGRDSFVWMLMGCVGADWTTLNLTVTTECIDGTYYSALLRGRIDDIGFGYGDFYGI